MLKESYDFLEDLLQTPSPSGFEQLIQKRIKKRMNRFADDIRVDVHGNLIACFNPEGRIRVMLAGHCDQIAMMVHHIDDQGFLHVAQIGGIDPAVLPGSPVVILTSGGPLDGVIGHKPVHLTTAADRGKPVEFSKIWIDIGAKNGAEARKLVSIGDPVTFRLQVTRLGGSLVASPGCDNKVGAFVVMEALRLVASKIRGKEKKKFPVALFSVSTVQEEIGLRGAQTSAFGIDPHVGIAVDVTHATDNPGADAKSIGSVKLGQGAAIARGPNINPVLENHMRTVARKKKIPVQLYAAPRGTGTDANAIQVTRAGVATALVSIPNRYMHTSVEVVDTKDLEITSRLLAETILGFTPRMSFIPGTN
ncbi:MAG TPA: M42 family metallopeptidase [Oligoflexia bacterium]|nr:M42 family metallopeptidase [Oligoflexia bacterium]HMP48733.1 M42 family metallopeptidase [Oligoflexia bacterium]